MSGVRVLVGTRKGAFILTADEKRERWDVCGPHFAGWEMYHLKGSPVDPNRLYASQSSGWFGQTMQRSDDGGIPGSRSGTSSSTTATPAPTSGTTARSTPGSSPASGTRTVAVRSRYRLRRSRRRGAVPLNRRRADLAGAFRAARSQGNLWQPGAGGMCLHTIVLDPNNPDRIFVAISAAGAFRTDDGGETWLPINRGLHSQYELPDPDADVGHCVHSMAMHPSRPDVLFMQKHWDVMRTDNAGESWHEVSGNLPSDFGFPIAVPRPRAGDDLRRSDQERLRALPTRRQAARLPQPHRRQRMGSRSPTGCRNRTATSTSCAMPWPSTRSTRAASTSAPRAGRSTHRPTLAIRGRRSCGTSRPSSPSKCRPCHDPRHAPGPSADPGADRQSRRARGGGCR